MKTFIQRFLNYIYTFAPFSNYLFYVCLFAKQSLCIIFIDVTSQLHTLHPRLSITIISLSADSSPLFCQNQPESPVNEQGAL